MQKKAEKKQKKEQVTYLVDKPHPFSVLKEERAKTQAAIEQTAVEKAVVDDQVKKLERQYKPEVEDYQAELDAEKVKQLQVPQKTVDQFQEDVKASTERVKTLKEQLQNEERNLGQISDSLDQAQKTLDKEAKAMDRNHQKAMKTKKALLNGALDQAKQAQKTTYRQHDKIIKGEKRQTMKAFLSESFKRALSDLAAIPDVMVKSARAQWAALKEVRHVFNRSAKKAQDAYAAPTWFSKTRRKPVVKNDLPQNTNTQTEVKTPKA